MKTKHVNCMLLGIFAFHIVLELWISNYSMSHSVSAAMGLLLGQFSLMVPALLFFLLYLGKRGKEEHPESVTERLHFKKIKGSSVAMIIVFTYLMMPLTTVVNAVSMLFVENTMMAVSDEILSLPFLGMISMVAVLPAFNEELIFRGIVYGAYRKSGRMWPAIILSGLVFGLMHMNINQAMYAFLLGVTMAALFESTGSIWSTILFHFVTNGNSCILMYLVNKFTPDILLNQAEMVNTPEQIYQVLGIYVVIAAVTTPVAICVLYWLSKNEKGNFPFAKKMDAVRENKQTIATIPYILFAICCVIYMIVQEIL